MQAEKEAVWKMQAQKMQAESKMQACKQAVWKMQAQKMQAEGKMHASRKRGRLENASSENAS